MQDGHHPAMFKVSRTATGTLIISQGRAQAVVRLVIWASVVVVFYLVVLGDAALSGERLQGDRAPPWHLWALLLFPLFLVPYLFSLIRALRCADELIFDGREKIICRRGRTLARFSDIRGLELRAVHGTCEEYQLSTVLAAGGSLDLLEAEASAATETLARELSELLQVPLIRKL